MKKKEKYKIAILTPSINSYSETFIKAHIDGIHGEKDVFYGGELPRFHNKGKIQSENFWICKLKNLIFNTAFSQDEWSVIKTIKAEKIQLIFIEYGTTAARVYKLIDYLKTPFVIHFHGFDISTHNLLSKNESCYKIMLPRASWIFAVSQSMQKKLRSLGAKEDKITCTPCGANEAYLNVVNTHEKNTFVTVGRFVEKKGPLYTIMAFHLLLNKGYKAKLKMIGDGLLKDLCVHYVKTHQLHEHIVFLGVLDIEGIATEFSKSICYVQHSITAQSGDQEGTPVSIMEAMLSGLPIIATNHGGIPDIVSEDRGILTEEKDTLAMATAMEDCINHPEKFQNMGLNGKNFIRENHTLQIHLTKINEAISTIL